MGVKIPSCNFDLVTKNGKKETGRVNIKILKDKDKKITSILIVIINVTEIEKKIKSQLQENEKNKKKYQSLFSGMLNGFALHEIVLNKNGKPIDYIFLEVNKSFEKLTGLKKNKIINKKVTEVLPRIKEDPANWIEKYGEVALSGREIKFENYTAALDKWFSIHAFSPEKGKFATVFEDTTERKRTEDKIKKSEEKYRTIAKTIPGVHYQCDMDWTFIFASPAIKELIGYPASDLINNQVRSYVSLMFDDDIERITPILNEDLKKKKKFFASEYKLKTKNKKIKWVRDSVRVLYNKKGEAIGYEGVLIDITERKEAEEKIKESEEKFRTVVTNLQAIVFILDKECIFLLSEGKALSLLGLKPGQVVGSSALKIFKEHPIITKGIKQALKGELIQEIVLVKKSYLDIFISPYKNAQGEMMGVIGIAADITTIQKAKKKMEEVSKVKTEFISLASHQLRTPLGAMRWNLEILLSDKKFKFHSQSQEIIENVYKSNLRVIKLVNNLLNISRIEQNKVKNIIEKVNIIDLLKEITEELKSELDKKNLNLHFKFL